MQPSYAIFSDAIDKEMGYKDMRIDDIVIWTDHRLTFIRKRE